MCGPDDPGHAVDGVAADINAIRSEERGILEEEFLHRGPPTADIALAEDLVKIAAEQGREKVSHDRQSQDGDQRTHTVAACAPAPSQVRQITAQFGIAARRSKVLAG